MTSIASVASTTSATSTSSTASASSSQEMQNRFLTLLVAQMKNQDPLNPMDNSQVTSQMAQLSTVTGIEQLNSTLSAYTQAQSFQSVNLIGHTILAPGNNLTLQGGASAAGFDLASAADSVKVSILNSSGQVVDQLNLGAQSAGVVPFSWDGTTTAGTTAADGSYTFKVDATAGGAAVTSTSLGLGAVNSVLMDTSGTTVNATGLGSVALSSIRQVL